MPKHSVKEILGIFASGAGHTHEKAVSDVYDAGFDAGKAHKTQEFQAGLGSPAPAAPATEGSTDEETQKGAEVVQSSQEGETGKDAAAS